MFSLTKFTGENVYIVPLVTITNDTIRNFAEPRHALFYHNEQPYNYEELVAFFNNFSQTGNPIPTDIVMERTNLISIDHNAAIQTGSVTRPIRDIIFNNDRIIHASDTGPYAMCMATLAKELRTKELGQLSSPVFIRVLGSLFTLDGYIMYSDHIYSEVQRAIFLLRRATKKNEIPDVTWPLIARYVQVSSVMYQAKKNASSKFDSYSNHEKHAAWKMIIHSMME